MKKKDGKTTKTKKLNLARQVSSKKRFFWYILTIFIIIISTIIASSYWYYSSGTLKEHIDKFTTSFYRQTANAGFFVKEVSLEGRKFTPYNKIQKTVKKLVKLNDPILNINTDKLLNEILKIKYIKSASVRIILPNKIIIKITERKPVVTWYNQKQYLLVAANGFVMGKTIINNNTVIITGKKANFNIEALLKIFKSVKLLKQIKHLQYIDDRRWRFHLKNSIIIDMPKDNIKQAYEKLIILNNKYKILTKKIKLIDLRVKDKIIIKLYKDINIKTIDKRGKNV